MDANLPVSRSKKNIQEYNYQPWSGCSLLLINFFILGTAIALIVTGAIFQLYILIVGIPLFIISFVNWFGFMVIGPNQAYVLFLCGKYKGTIKFSGFYWINPFLACQSVSLRLNNFESASITVNDKRGNPIEIGVIVVWRMVNTAKAFFRSSKLFGLCQNSK